MGTPFVGEIRMFAGNFAPVDWQFCNGQLLAIAEFETLFQLIGTTYGGDGVNTFALPDLRGRVPVHYGQGPGLSSYTIGQRDGQPSVTLNVNQLPAHTHEPIAASGGTRVQSPVGAIYSVGEADLFATAPGDSLQSALAAVGGNQPHPNEQPVQCVSFIISMFGIFPSPN